MDLCIVAKLAALDDCNAFGTWVTPHTWILELVGLEWFERWGRGTLTRGMGR